MLEDAAGIRRVVLACGFVDLRKGIDGLAQIVGARYDLNPFVKGTLFLFCGRRSVRIKGLLWMGNGFLLLYIRFEDGSLSWPRTQEEAVELTEEQFRLLMLGLNPIEPKIKDVQPTKVCKKYCAKERTFSHICLLQLQDSLDSNMQTDSFYTHRCVIFSFQPS